jgi:hypothetical protein
LSGSWFYTNFESERFLDTTSYLGTLSLTRRVSRRDSISANAGLQTTVDDLTTRRIPAFYAGYGHLFGTSLQLGLAAGAARDDNYYAEEVTPPWTFYGSANLSGRIRRVALTLSYSRGLQPLIGLGVTQVTDSLGLGLELPIGRRFRLLSNGVLALRATPLDTAARRLEWDAYFGGSAALSERISLALGYRFRRREDPLGMLSNDRASVSLVYAGRPR